MKRLIIPFIAILVLFTACHSNNSNNVTPSNDIWGSMTVTRRTSDSNFIFPGIDDETAIAQFYSSANSYWTHEPVTRISVNGHKLDDNGDTVYIDQPGAGIDTHVLWDITGAGQVPTFSYDHPGPFPQYTGPKIPDTITRANGFAMSFPAGSYSSGDSVMIVFNEYEDYWSKSVDQNHQIVFSPQELSRLHTGVNFVNLNITKMSYRTFAGKQYYFAQDRIYMSSVFVQ